MSLTPWEDGERMEAHQEDLIAGRLPHQSAKALKAKKVRSFIAAHPGCGSFELAKQFGHKGFNGSLDWLLDRKLIRFEQSPQRIYFVVPL